MDKENILIFALYLLTCYIGKILNILCSQNRKYIYTVYIYIYFKKNHIMHPYFYFHYIYLVLVICLLVMRSEFDHLESWVIHCNSPQEGMRSPVEWYSLLGGRCLTMHTCTNKISSNGWLRRQQIGSVVTYLLVLF